MIEIGGKVTGTKGETTEGMKDDTIEIQGTIDGTEDGTTTDLETDLQLAFTIVTDIGMASEIGVIIESVMNVMGGDERTVDWIPSLAKLIAS